MSEFTKFRRSQIAELREYVPGEILSDRVSISASDRESGSPKAGDMIARNPANHDDQWLIAADYFAANFEPSFERVAAISAPVGETVLGPNDPWCGAINPEGYRDSPPAPHVPEGWRVVPVEATEAMNNAGYKEWNRLHAASVALIYRAMLSASPAAPLVGGDGWRDIASAPKDGTHIILAFGQDHSSEGWYEDDDNDPRPWRFIDMADFNEVIINSCRDGEYGPSHWQPMPYREPRNHPTPPPPEGTR